jgi:hypothetical protein
MALYKYLNILVQTDDPAFDVIYKPGQTPPHSGIYRCEGCGHEVVAEASRSFPTQNHKQHTSAQGDIRWRLIVYPQPAK